MKTAQPKLNAATVIMLLILVLAAVSVRGADYVLAMDVSGSMISPVSAKGGKSRVATVQEAVRNYLAALPQGSRVTMIAFNDRFDERETILNTDADRRALTQWIDGFSAEVKLNRGTRLYQALRRALTVAREYARQNPNQFIEVRVLTDGEDDSRVPAERAIQEMLRDFPEVDAKTIKANLVLCGDWSSSMIVRLEEKLRPLGVGVTDARNLSQPILPPVIIQSPDPVEAGHDVLFADNSSTPFLNYEWEVDGREAGRGKSLKQRFDREGNYRIAVIGTTSSGRKLRADKLVQVVSSGITASFTFFPSVPEPGEEVRFFGRASGKLAHWEWAINGRSCGEGQDMTARFPSADTYDVMVTVTDTSGSAISLTNHVEVRVGALTVGIKGPEESLSGSEVQFASEVVGKATAYLWDFDDGTSSIERNPAHQFPLSGPASSPKAFTVRLKVKGASGQIAQTEHTVSIVPPKKEAAPRAAFQPQGGLTHKAGAAIQFLNESKGQIERVVWIFDSAGETNTANPVFVFNEAGTKKVRLEVSGAGDTNAFEATLEILPRYIAPQIVSVEASVSSQTAPLAITLTAHTTGDVANVTWLLPDGAKAAGTSIVHRIVHPGLAQFVATAVPMDQDHPTANREFTFNARAPIPVWLWMASGLALLTIAGIALRSRITASRRDRRH
ncbi:MAG: PKD domain-containing protein [Verrucomicrobiales bacterium]|nr:PKD domain-containing protein [Verrucomicrobiales bacterium]